MQLYVLLAITALGSSQIYQWVDPSGQKHYSDVPRPGWEPVNVDVARPSTVTPMAVPRPERPEPAAGDDGSRYDALSIRSPGQEEVLWNIEGQLEVSTALSPPLRQGHVLFLYLDDQPVARLEPGDTVARLSGVWRGEHTLRAEVLDSSNQPLIRSEPVTFYVRQTSVANPQNPLLQQPGTAPQ